MKRIKIYNLILSILLSLSINLKLIIDNDLEYFIKEFKFGLNYFINVIILTVILYFLFIIIFKLFDKIKFNNSSYVISRKKIVFIFFSILFTTVVFLLVHYPAVYLNDTYYLIYSPIYSSNGHPLFYSLVLSILFFTFRLFFDLSFSMFCLSLLQAIISSVILTYIIVWFNDKFKNKYLTLLLFLYFVFTPVVSNYNMALNKDSLYALMFLIFFTFYYEIINTKGEILKNKKFVFKLILISVIVTYIRNNGVYVIVSSLFIIYFLYGFRKYKISSIVSLFLILLLSSVPSYISRLNNVEYLKREKYAVPIQQISYLVKYHPDSLDEDDYKLLSKVIKNPKETISSNYNEFCVDSIKFDDTFDNDNFNKLEKDFLLLWFDKLLGNFNSYVKSYLLNTYHLWSIDELDKFQSLFTYASVFGVKEEHQFNNEVILPKAVQNVLVSYYKVFNTFINPALCFIVLLIMIVYALNKNNYKILLYSLPLIMTWLILMVASPLSSALRYMSIYIYLLPIIIFITFREVRS